ncbi:SpoIIIAH-like family protein [Thermovenabulum sp.]|uniref:SpoIIIAH-like family protein n=1 Tax=Thermovenabulum sp. TaxID=3100335 RepID=UPI003C7AFDED
MTFLFERKRIIVGVLVLLLIFSVYLMLKSDYPKLSLIKENKSEKNTLQQVSKNGLEKNFFIDYRLERDRLRSQEADYLREIINNPNASKESKEKAQKDLIALAQKIEKEMMMENLIKAKGFEDSVVILAENSANVVVKSGGLQPNEVAQITDIVNRITGLPLDKITIVERK